jgi:DNA invertase Pin-like site-specific DNA recombinase
VPVAPRKDALASMLLWPMLGAVYSTWLLFGGSTYFARSVKQLVLALEEFRMLGIDFVSHQEALDTSTSMGRAMFTIIAAIAELERNIIRERVISGLDHAQRNGTRSGKPVGRPRVVFRHDQVLELRKDHRSWRQIAKECGVGVTTVRRAYRSITAALGVPKPDK